MRRPLLFVVITLALALAACDSVTGLWDPTGERGTGASPGAGEGSGIQTIGVGGDAVDGRPQVDAAFPEGNGWPESVPIVVCFSESVNRESVSPPAGGDPTLFVRAVGSTTVIAAAYDFLFGDTVVVMRTLAPLVAPQGTPEFEVVVTSDLTDADGVTFGGSETIVATFTADEASGGGSIGDINDGRVLTLLPLDNERDVPREVPIYAVFTKEADATTVTASSFSVRQAGTPLAGELSFPIGGLQATDTRILRFDADDLLPASAEIDVVVDETITFEQANGVLDFGNRSPFASFRTLAFSSPMTVAVGNAMPSFPDKVNLANFESLVVDVTTDSTAAAGDQVVVRLYGLDPVTSVAGDVNFVERSRDLPAAGAQTVSVDFSAALGTVASPLFEDGGLALVAQARRGSRRTGFIGSDGQNEPRLDVTPPTLSEAGPPTTDATLDLFSDLEQVAFHGQASEEVTSATLTAGALSADIYAADDEGRFVLAPIDLGMGTEPVSYEVSLTDTAGNLAPVAFSGRIVPRGVVSGSVGASFTVEAYDESTLQPVVGATVIVQPDSASSAGRRIGVTGTDGRVTVTGLAPPMHTVTVVASGYDLKSLVDTGADFASLGLAPATEVAGSFSGTAAFVGAQGATVLVGHNLIDDPLEEDVASLSTAPLAIPPTLIRPNRPQLITAFAGVFEPVASPAFVFAACQLCGADGLTPTAPPAPVDPGGDTSTNLVLQQAGLATLGLGQHAVDFSTAGGLGPLSGTPSTRVVGAIQGFPGQALFGVGFAANTGGEMFSVDGTLWTVPIINLAQFAPAVFISTEAVDSSGNVSRHRAAVDPLTGATTLLIAPPGIPTIAAPSGPTAGPPVITFDDWLDPSLLAGSQTFLELTATDGAGRRWTVFRQDNDIANLGDQIQLPNLSGTGATGLAAGTWSVRAENHVLLSATASQDNFVFEELRRAQIGYSRARAVNFVVN